MSKQIWSLSGRKCLSMDLLSTSFHCPQLWKKSNIIYCIRCKNMFCEAYFVNHPNSFIAWCILSLLYFVLNAKEIFFTTEIKSSHSENEPQRILPWHLNNVSKVSSPCFSVGTSGMRWVGKWGKDNGIKLKILNLPKEEVENKERSTLKRLWKVELKSNFI